MTTDARPRQGLAAGPRLAVARCLLWASVAPLVASAVALALPLLVWSWWSILAAGAAVVFLVERGGSSARSTWRRFWWRYDARAAGLVVLAEPSVNAVYEARSGVLLEVAPLLVRVRVSDASFRLTVRPLPGQTAATFEAATEALAWRWKASAVTVSAARGRGLVTIEARLSADDLPAEAWQ